MRSSKPLIRKSVIATLSVAMITGLATFASSAAMKKRIVISLAGALCAISAISPVASAASMNGPFGPNWKGPAQWALAPNVDTYDMPKPFYVPQSEIPVPHGAGPSTGAFFAEAIMGAQPQSTLPAATQQAINTINTCTPYVNQAEENGISSGGSWAQSTMDYYGLSGASTAVADYGAGYTGPSPVADTSLALFWEENIAGNQGTVTTSQLQNATQSLVNAQNALASGEQPSQALSSFVVQYGSGYNYYDSTQPLMKYLPNDDGDAEAFLKDASGDLSQVIQTLNSGGVANVPQVCMSWVQSGYQNGFANAANAYFESLPPPPNPTVPSASNNQSCSVTAGGALICGGYVYTGYGKYALSALQANGFNPTIVDNNVSVSSATLNAAASSALQMDGGAEPSAQMASYVFSQGLTSDGVQTASITSQTAAQSYASLVQNAGSTVTISGAQQMQNVAASGVIPPGGSKPQ